MSSDVQSKKKLFTFMYGTLKRGQPNHYRLCKEYGGCSFVGKARTVQPFPLVIASNYNIPFLLCAEGKGQNVVGEVYEIDEVMLESLDEFECVPTLYERDLIMLALTHDAQDEELKKVVEIECCCYYLKKYKPELLEAQVFNNYDAYGDHGLHYVPRCERDRLAKGYHPAIDVIVPTPSH